MNDGTCQGHLYPFQPHESFPHHWTSPHSHAMFRTKKQAGSSMNSTWLASFEPPTAPLWCKSNMNLPSQLLWPLTLLHKPWPTTHNKPHYVHHLIGQLSWWQKIIINPHSINNNRWWCIHSQHQPSYQGVLQYTRQMAVNPNPTVNKMQIFNPWVKKACKHVALTTKQTYWTSQGVTLNCGTW